MYNYFKRNFLTVDKGIHCELRMEPKKVTYESWSQI